MKFKYHVKHDGVWYAPGEEVPIKPQKTEEKVVEEVKTETEPEAEPTPKRRGRQPRGRQ